MTKKDFEAIAMILDLASSRGSDEADVAEDIAHDLADLFGRKYRRFDRSTFLVACGVRA